MTDTGSLAIGTVATSGTLDLNAGSTATAASVNLVNNSALRVAGAGSQLSVSGELDVGPAAGDNSFLSVYNGGTVQAGSLVVDGRVEVSDAASALLVSGAVTLANGSLTVISGTLSTGSLTQTGGTLNLTGITYTTAGALSLTGGSQSFNQVALQASSVTLSGDLALDAQSSLEVGAGGVAAKGAVTVDAGHQLSFVGNEYLANYNYRGYAVPIIDNGTVSVSGGDLHLSTFYDAGTQISGTGLVKLGSGGSLHVGQIASTNTIDFSGSNSKLYLFSTIGANTATISGFAAGNGIDFTGANDAVYMQTSLNQGTLSLVKAGVTVGTIDVIGNYNPAQFVASTVSSNEVLVNLADLPPFAPTIAGTRAGHDITDTQTVDPFASVTITDRNATNEPETVTVTPSSAANGTLSDAIGGSVDAVSGIYTVTGTPTAVTAALETLVFTPTPHEVPAGNIVTTGFTLTATNALFRSITDATTTVVVTATAAPVTLPNFAAASGTLGVQNGGHVTLGTAIGVHGDGVTATLVTDGAGLTGSTVVVDPSTGNVVYNPGLITAAKVGADTISYTLTDSVTGAQIAETQAVALDNKPNPVVTLAASPIASNVAPAVLGTAVAGFGHDALSVTLNSDSVFASGSSLALSNGQLIYTPGAITAGAVDTIHYTVTDTVTGASVQQGETLALQPILTGGSIDISLTPPNTPSWIETQGGSGEVGLGNLHYGANNGGYATPIAGYDGYYTLDLKFFVPANATGVTLAYNGVGADDREVLELNGTPVASDGIIYGPGPETGLMQFVDNGPYVPWLFNANPSAGTVTTGFIAGAVNDLKLIVNNSGTGVFGATSSPDLSSVAGLTGTITYGLPAAHMGTTVNLSGYSNTVDAPATAAHASGAAAGSIEGAPYGNTTIAGTAANEIINAYGWSNTIVANGGADTINAGQGQAHVTVSDPDGDNTVRGSQGGTGVTLGDGNNTIALSGYNNSISLGHGNNVVYAGDGNEEIVLGGGSTAVTVGGWSDAFTLGDGAFTIGGMQGDAGIKLTSAFSPTDSLDLLGTAGDTFTNVGGILTIKGPNNSVYATVDATATGKGLQYQPDTKGGMQITLAANPANPAITGNTGTGSGQPSTITETQGNAKLQIGSGDRTVILQGWNNIVSGGAGAHVVQGAQGNTSVTLLGDNTVTMAGYNNVISLGTGSNRVQAGDGNESVTVGGGASTLQAGGYSNHFTVSAAGQSTITAGAGNEWVSLAGGTDVVHLAGWSNFVIGAGGSTTVDGGMGNTYEVDAVGSKGGFTVTDFGNGDVLDLSKVLGKWDHTQTGLADLLRVGHSGNDVTMSVFSGGSFQQVAFLQGAGATTGLVDLQNQGAIKLG